MAEIYPKKDREDFPKNDAEWKVCELLKNLPSDWYVFSGLTWSKVDNGKKNFEIDFLILIPEYGIIALEVKGYRELKRKDGKWIADGKEKNPFHQRNDLFKFVDGRVCKDLLLKKNEFKYHWILVLPFIKHLEQFPENNPELVWIAKDLETKSITAKFRSVIKKEMVGDTVVKTEVFDKLKKYLVDEIRSKPSRDLILDVDLKRIDKNLTEEQKTVFRLIESNRYLWVEGIAGSGKTLIALHAAKQIAEKNPNARVLYLCYNTLLCLWLNKEINKEKQSNLDVFTIEGFLKKHTSEIKNFKRNEIYDRLINSFYENENGYSLVFIDEAQDIPSDKLREIADYAQLENFRLYIFKDKKQTLYENANCDLNEHNEIPEIFTRFPLERNLRNSLSVIAGLETCIKSKIEYSDNAPPGLKIEVRKGLEDVKSRARQVESLVDLLLKDRIKKSSIAVLTPWGFGGESKHEKRNSLQYLDESLFGMYVSDKSETHDDLVECWIRNEIVLTSAIRSFKGLEADIIIITDVPSFGGSKAWNKEIICYQALSRAKITVYFFPEDEKAENELRAIMK